MEQLYIYRATGAAAAAPTFAPGVTVKIRQISFSLSAAGGESLSATVDSLAGSEYDATLISESMNGITSLIKTDINYLMQAGSELDFSYTNALTRTWGLEVVYERVGP